MTRLLEHCIGTKSVFGSGKKWLMVCYCPSLEVYHGAVPMVDMRCLVNKNQVQTIVYIIYIIT